MQRVSRQRTALALLLCFVQSGVLSSAPRWTARGPGRQVVLPAGTPYSSAVPRRPLGRPGTTAPVANAVASPGAPGTLLLSCESPANAIVEENCLTGHSGWGITGSGSPNIQGFATEMSVNVGEPVGFKIDTPATAYRLDIYRMGDYAGLGARKVATIEPTATLPQNQPSCLVAASTGLVDCGNWGLSATWTAPLTAVSGIYFAKLVREDVGGPEQASHVFFVVRNDDSESDLLFQTSDTTWQAYNSYGGNSLYTGSPAGRVYKVSYNRPLNTRTSEAHSFVLSAEAPMVRFLERNGYDVSYFSGVDSDRFGSENPRPQGLPVGRPRRVLVGPAARERGSRAERRRPSGVLQR